MTNKDFNSSEYELIDELEEKITKCFVELFSETDEALDIASWTERFKLVGVTGYQPTEGLANWEITFEDTREPFAHFNLQMKGREPGDFSIDT